MDLIVSEMAEREGFEPSMGDKTHRPLAGARLQPLGHLSRKIKCVVYQFRKCASLIAELFSAGFEGRLLYYYRAFNFIPRIVVPRLTFDSSISVVKIILSSLPIVGWQLLLFARNDSYLP